MPTIWYIVLVEHNSRKMYKGTLDDFRYKFYNILNKGKEWRESINERPESMHSLIDNVNLSFKELNKKAYLRLATDAEIEEYEIVNR